VREFTAEILETCPTTQELLPPIMSNLQELCLSYSIIRRVPNPRSHHLHISGLPVLQKLIRKCWKAHDDDKSVEFYEALLSGNVRELEMQYEENGYEAQGWNPPDDRFLYDALVHAHSAQTNLRKFSLDVTLITNRHFEPKLNEMKQEFMVLERSANQKCPSIICSFKVRGAETFA
jgi:hypothetical protein